MVGWHQKRHLACLSILGFLVSSCKVDQRLAADLTNIERELATDTSRLAASLQSSNERILAWKDAMRLLETRNLELLRSRIRIERIKEARDEQWKTWLPTVSAFTSFQRSLTDIGDISLSDLNVSVVAPLRIPNPLSEQAQAFQNALSYLQAVDSAELSYRRQITNLHLIYTQAQDLEEANKDVPIEPTIESGLGNIEKSRTRAASRAEIRARLARLLDLPGTQPYPLATSRPSIDYSNRISRLVPGQNYGELAIRLSSYQIEGALLREKGVAMQRWPDLSLSASSPAIYDSRREGEFDFFDGERFSLFGGLSKTYEFTGREAESIESAEQNTYFLRKSIQQQLDSDARDWIRLKDRYRLILTKQKIAQERLSNLRKNNTISSVATLKALRSAQSNLLALKVAKERLDTEIWIWDESKWPN